MGFFGESTKKTEVGKCMSCGKAMIGGIGIESGKLIDKPEITLKDGTFICKECVLSKDLLDVDVENKTKGELLKFYKDKGLVSPDYFTPTKRVKYAVNMSFSPRKHLVYMEIDENKELINIPIFDKGIMFDDLRDWVIPWSKILDFKIIDNGKQVMEGNSILGAAVGGVFFGGAGAIVGSALPSRSISNTCTELTLKIIIDDMKVNTRYINFIGSNSEITDAYRGSGNYTQALCRLEECISILTIILRRRQEKMIASQQPHAQSSKDEIIDAIKKIAELKEAGILTEDEFEKKKKEFMDRL